MKKTLFVFFGLFSLNTALAEDLYRPYASCFSTSGNTRIEVMQNTNPVFEGRSFRFSVFRTIRENKISMLDQNAVQVPIERKDVLEFFQGHENKSRYWFELLVFKQAPASMAGTFKAHYFDFLGRSVVYCSHHITFESGF